MPTKQKKSWTEKLNDSKDLPKVIKLTGKGAEKWGEGTMVIPAPIMVDQLMRQVTKGKLTTINEIRSAMADSCDTDHCCPITAGIFSWIAAHAADEQSAATKPTAKSKKPTTAFWRTLKSGGELNPKYPGGIGGLKKSLQAEGHKVVQRGKKFFVEDFEEKLFKKFKKVKSPK